MILLVAPTCGLAESNSETRSSCAALSGASGARASGQGSTPIRCIAHFAGTGPRREVPDAASAAVVSAAYRYIAA